MSEMSDDDIGSENRYKSKWRLYEADIRLRRQLALGALVKLVTVMAIVTGLFGLFAYKYFPSSAAKPDPYRTAIEALNRQLDEMESKITALQKTIELSKDALQQNAAGQEIVSLRVSGQQLDERMKRLEDAISAAPDKALSIPMLRKDVDQLESTVAANRTASLEELGRMSTFNVWFLGLIGTLGVTLMIGMFKFLKKPLPPSKEDED